MKLEDQCVSIDLSKRLKELGVKQDSLYSWFETKRYGIIIEQSGSEFDLEYYLSVGRLGSAFTVAELGEMLPYNIMVNGQSYFFEAGKASKANPYISEHEVNYSYGDECIHLEREDTEADARAKMLIYLIENGIIKEDWMVNE